MLFTPNLSDSLSQFAPAFSHFADMFDQKADFSLRW